MEVDSTAVIEALRRQLAEASWRLALAEAQLAAQAQQQTGDEESTDGG